MDDDDDIRAAAQARQELRHTEAAFERLRAALIEEWATTSLGQDAKREKLFMAVQTLDAVRRALMGVVGQGEIANARVELAKAGFTRP